MNNETKLTVLSIMYVLSILAFIASSLWAIIDNTGSMFGPAVCLGVAIVTHIYYLIYAVRWIIQLGTEDKTPDNSKISETYGFIRNEEDQHNDDNSLDS